ncbi:hypothetical protein L1987_50948 [Smallanthus sonchifolius]|uniref:Uncharacterized protein n=1 Tax=Smallanthus sonchifolius TaxID=185202 RepID=A0ACB9ENW3_9ASTR|nr:hypothetical protein L1987_50948 [Smallanthus sonchifolius]
MELRLVLSRNIRVGKWLLQAASPVAISPGKKASGSLLLKVVGAEMLVVNKSAKAFSLQQDGMLFPDKGQEASS